MNHMLFSRKTVRIRTGKGKGTIPFTDCMQEPESKAVV
jgi:hypothetical protein